MRVVDRKEFLSLPPGVLYTEFKPCYTHGLLIKHDTLDNGDDWFYTELIASSAECDGLVQMEEGTELPFDPDWTGRDGAFDSDQQFIIYSEEDIRLFSETLLDLTGDKE